MITLSSNGPVSPSVGPAAALSTMDRCTKCNLCQSYCPVMAVTERFPGPKYAGPQAERFRVIGPSIDHSTDLCTGCGICTSICPNEVAISDIITIAKARNVDHGSRLSISQRILNRPELIGSIGGVIPTLSNAVLKNSALRLFAKRILGIHEKAALPAFQGRAFRRWFAGHDQREGLELLYFPGCAVDNFDPQTGIAAVMLLNKMGYRVRLSAASCCSLPMLSSGEWRPAKRRARKLVDMLASELGNKDTIISTSTSCGLTLKSKYGIYLGMNDTNTKLVSAATKDICEFVRDQGLYEAKTTDESRPKRVFYHAPCQLRGHGIGFPALELLSRISGLEVIASEAACCGIGGTYGYAAEKHGISTLIAQPILEQIATSSPDVIACDSETCRWHLEILTRSRAVHPAELLISTLADSRPSVK
jgi:glycerol-3-phosphate dehydrogenase subunit C